MATLQELLDNPDSPWVFLLYVNALLDATPTVQVVRFSKGAEARTNFGDANGQYFPYLRQALSMATQINPLELGERADTSFGVVQVALSDDGHFDSMADLAFDGRQLLIYLGLPTDDLAFFNELFRGYAERVYYDERLFSIVLRDPGIAFDKPIQSTLYLGDGTTYEGGAELEGTPKPICFGKPLNITPVLVDSGSLIYQIHDGEIKALASVRDQGVQLVSDGDTTDLTTWTPIAGRFKTDLSRGCFRLGQKAVGMVTCDPEGDNDCPDVTFPQSAAEIVRRVAKQRAGLASGDLDSASFTQLDTDAPYDLSYYTGTSNPSIAQVLDEVLGSVGGFRYFNRSGDLVVGQMRFGTSSRTLDYDRGHIAGIRLEQDSPQPAWRLRLGYARKWTVMGPADFAGATSAAFRDSRSREFNYRVEKDEAIRDLHALARAIKRPSLIDSSTDAGTEATRQFDILKAVRVFEVEARRQQFQMAPGQTITIKHPRFGFSAGKDAVVLGVTENENSRDNGTRLRVAVVT